MKRRGRFVVLEGLDGAGTTTQAARLAEALRRAGHQVILTREPSDGPVGTLLRSALDGRLRLPGRRKLSDAALALLFAADRLDHLASTVEPGLAAGAVVVSDRYALSSLAYQGRVLGQAWVLALNARARTPDLTLFLEVRPRVAAARRRMRGGRQERFDDAHTQASVARAYDAVMTLHQRAHHVRRIDGERDVDTVAAEVRVAVAGLFGRRNVRARGRLR
jgi:dTMP kinase